MVLSAHFPDGMVECHSYCNLGGNRPVTTVCEAMHCKRCETDIAFLLSMDDYKPFEDAANLVVGLISHFARFRMIFFPERRNLTVSAPAVQRAGNEA